MTFVACEVVIIAVRGVPTRLGGIVIFTLTAVIPAVLGIKVLAVLVSVVLVAPASVVLAILVSVVLAVLGIEIGVAPGSVVLAVLGSVLLVDPVSVLLVYLFKVKVTVFDGWENSILTFFVTCFPFFLNDGSPSVSEVTHGLCSRGLGISLSGFLVEDALSATVLTAVILGRRGHDEVNPVHLDEIYLYLLNVFVDKITVS